MRNLLNLNLSGVMLTALLTSCLALGACGDSMVPTTPEASDLSGSTTSRRSLARLLTGDVVSAQEAQLRDNLRREIVLDFPVRLGVVFFQLDSKLDPVDQEAVFKATREALEGTEMIKETVMIPASFAEDAGSLEALRTLGSRFQTDLLLVVTGKHAFELARAQREGFIESFGERGDYDSQVTLEAIALDVFTGTLLRPFAASAKGEVTTFDRSGAQFAADAYAYQKAVEDRAWEALNGEVLSGLEQLEVRVERARNSIRNSINAEVTP